MAVVSPPHPGDEAARLEALRGYHILDTPPEPAFDELTRLAAYVCQAPIALVVFVDEKRQWFKSRLGLELAETPREWAICAHTLHERDVLIVRDASQDPRFSAIPYVRDPTGIRFYAGTALRSPDGLALGTLCVLDRVPRGLDPGPLDALRVLGRQAEAQLELRRQSGRLGDALAREHELRQALDRSEERFRQLVENVQDVFWIREVDPPRLLYINAAYERIWGRPRAELEADPLAFLAGVHPEDRERVAVRYARQGLEEYEEEYRVVQPGGGVRWVLSRAFPVRDERGVLRRVAGVSHDITARKAAEAELQAQKGLLANLLAVARATTELPTLEATLSRTLEVMKGLTGAEAASLLLLDDAGRLSRSLFSFADQPAGAWREEGLQVLETGLASWVASRQQPALVEDVEVDPRWMPLAPSPHATRSALSVPILSGRALVGVLTLEHSQRGYFAPGHLELVQAASGQMALALLNAQVFDALDRMGERQATLYEVLRASGEQLDPDAALRQAVKVIAHRTGWPNVAISVPGDGGCWEICASNDDLSRVGRQPMTSGVVGRAYASGRVQRVPDVRLDPDYLEGAPSIRSEVAVPIRRGERVMGVLNVESDVRAGFDDEDVGLAASLADAVGLALENARLYRAVAAESDRVRSFVRASRDGILLVGADGRVVLGNDPACRLLGLAGTGEDWVGRPLAELLRPLRAASPAGEAGMAGAATRSAGGEATTEGECLRPPFTIQWSAREVLSGGVSLGRSLVLRDVTAERRAQRLQEDLTHTLVHDLRNPLTSLQGAIEMLSACEPPLTDRQHGLFEIAERSTQRVLGLVTAILDVTRLEKGAMPVSPRSIALPLLVEETLTLQEHVARQRRVELVNEVPADLPHVAADLALLERVLQNLLDNALKFTPDAGRVLVTARVYPEDDCFVEVVVSDSGPGLPPVVRERPFQKFVTGSKGGSGLGLTFCRLAVEAHAGRIWLGDEAGGAAVHFTLPVHA